MRTKEKFLQDMLTFEYVTPEGEELKIDFYSELIDFSKPRKNYLELPATYGFLTSVAAELMRTAITFENELEQWIAHEYDALLESGWKGEAKIKQQIILSTTWARKKRKVNKAWAMYMKVKGLQEALALKYGIIEKKFTKGTELGLLSEFKPSLLRRMELFGSTPKHFSKRGIGIPKASKKEAKRKIDSNEEEEE